MSIVPRAILINPIVGLNIMNKAIVTGRVGFMGDVEEKGPNDTPTLNFTMYVNEKRNGEQHSTKFPCVAFNKTAEIISQYVKKGDFFCVDGKIQTSEWEDKDSGEKKSNWKVIVNQFSFVGSSSNDEDDDQPF
jgi:single-strand DNA-binding protein